MAYKQVTYGDVRPEMQPGDIIAFSGKGYFSEIIKWSTRSVVSHVGIIFESKVLLADGAQEGKVVDVMEATTLYENPRTGRKTSGVQRNRLSDRVNFYDGDMWWLPLSAAKRGDLDIKAFTNFLMHQDNKEYDMPQAVKSALDAMDNVRFLKKATYNTEDFSSFFCSELATAALEASGAIGNINASEVTPIDLCQFNLFGGTYYQIRGSRKGIGGYNSRDPEGFGL